MCIAIICTSHVDYPYIIINNRDEYLTRPTARAAFWDPPNEQVLGGRDLQREVRGTWLGITKQGRLAVLTNYREHGDGGGGTVSGLKSRGAMVNSYLTTPPESKETTEDFAKRLVEEVGVTDVGGFSLLFGKLAPFKDASQSEGHANGYHENKKQGGEGFAIVSNRNEKVDDVTWLAERPGGIHGLSNSHFGDLTWPKVVHGELLVRQAIESNMQRGAGKQDLLDRLFEILSLDTLPRRKAGEQWETYLTQLRNSIFIPPIGGEVVIGKPADEIAAADGNNGEAEKPVVTSGDGHYATQKQTVILVDKEGKVTFVEKTLFDQHCRPLKNSKEEYEFDIEGWGT